jgi:hypothetical protein
MVSVEAIEVRMVGFADEHGTTVVRVGDFECAITYTYTGDNAGHKIFDVTVDGTGTAGAELRESSSQHDHLRDDPTAFAGTQGAFIVRGVGVRAGTGDFVLVKIHV